MRFNYSRWRVLTWRLDLAKQGFNVRDDLTAKKQVISSFSRGWSQACLKICGLIDLWCSICWRLVIGRPDLSRSPWFWPSWVDIRPDFLPWFCPVVDRLLTEPAVVIKLPSFGLCLLYGWHFSSSVRSSVWQKGSRHNLEQSENNPRVPTGQESKGGSV